MSSETGILHLPEASHPSAAASVRSKVRALVAKLQRYGLAILAPAAVSAAHFIVQVILVLQVTPAEFGLFAFFMIIVQLGYGISNALVSTPYTVSIHQADATEEERRAFFAISGLYALAFGAVCAGVAALFEAGSWAYLFAIFGMTAMFRWFGRAHSYAEFQQTTAALSDFLYSGCLLASVGGLVLLGRLEMDWIALAFLSSSLIGLLAFGRKFLWAQFVQALRSHISSYGKVWKEQARWTLVGVVSTEATSNAHSYLVTSFAGPAAFAPLAAAALFLRPVLLAITSLTQLERPVMSKAIAGHEVARADSTRKSFFAALLAVWFAVVLLAVGLLWFRPEDIAKASYNIEDFQIAVALIALVVLVQVWQAPNSVFLQAAKEFKALATTSLYACFFSILLAAAALYLAGPIYSLAGIVAGQAIMAVQISLKARNWRRQHG
jgi:O-antigen/teichoic acid export membrane protein